VLVLVEFSCASHPQNSIVPLLERSWEERMSGIRGRGEENKRIEEALRKDSERKEITGPSNKWGWMHNSREVAGRWLV
jgi:hypothetical protein